MRELAVCLLLLATLSSFAAAALSIFPSAGGRHDFLNSDFVWKSYEYNLTGQAVTLALLDPSASGYCRLAPPTSPSPIAIFAAISWAKAMQAGCGTYSQVFHQIQESLPDVQAVLFVNEKWNSRDAYPYGDSLHHDEGVFLTYIPKEAYALLEEDPGSFVHVTSEVPALQTYYSSPAWAAFGWTFFCINMAFLGYSMAELVLCLFRMRSMNISYRFWGFLSVVILAIIKMFEYAYDPQNSYRRIRFRPYTFMVALTTFLLYVGVATLLRAWMHVIFMGLRRISSRVVFFSNLIVFLFGAYILFSTFLGAAFTDATFHASSTISRVTGLLNIPFIFVLAGFFFFYGFKVLSILRELSGIPGVESQSVNHVVIRKTSILMICLNTVFLVFAVVQGANSAFSGTSITFNIATRALVQCMIVLVMFVVCYGFSSFTGFGLGASSRTASYTKDHETGMEKRSVQDVPKASAPEDLRISTPEDEFLEQVRGREQEHV